jgi:hypothetical protein
MQPHRAVTFPIGYKGRTVPALPLRHRGCAIVRVPPLADVYVIAASDGTI